MVMPNHLPLAKGPETLSELDAPLKKGNYVHALKLLTILSHQHIGLLQGAIEKIVADESMVDSTFKLRVLLFQSEQKLNEQLIDEAASIIESVIAQSELFPGKTVLILALLQKAVLNLYRNNADESIQLFHACEQMLESTNDIEVEIQIAIYGYHFFSESDSHKAAEYIYRALDLAKQHQLVYWEAYSLLHLGTLNTLLNNNAVALDYYAESFALFNQLQLNIPMADNLMCQFNIYTRMQDYDTAITCLEQAIELGQDCGWDHKIAICYGNISTLYLRQSNFEAAKIVAEKDIALSRQLNNAYNIGVAMFRLGRIEAGLGNITKAIELINESISIRKNIISNTQLSHVYQILFPLYAQVGDFKSAFETQSNFMKLKFEIVDAEKTKESEALRAKYEAEKREAELKEARLQHTESELKALKAQMNPHFIFNALNSIQEIFFLGDKRLANKHLARFSQLMRSILKSSGKKTISLQEELTMLEEYLSLEALRFGDTFSYSITMDDNVDPYTLDVPPMIIQPFVENAVKHGLLHKEGEQCIQLHVKFNESRSIIEVALFDNGVGRKASAEINKHRQSHESFSTSATQKRFEILNQSTVELFSFDYEDMEDENGLSLGTRVHIVLPIEN